MIFIFETIRQCVLKVYRKRKYPYNFYFDIDEKYKDMIEWVSENIKNEWKHWWEYSEPYSEPCGYSFGFKNTEDAMAFKLRWA